MMPYQSFSRASPGESHWKAIGKPLDPAWLKWSHVITGELLRIHWEGPKAIAGAHSKTIHDGSLEGLEGRHQQVGWRGLCPSQGELPSTIFIGKRWDIYMEYRPFRSGSTTHGMFWMVNSCLPELLYVIWVNTYSIHMTVKQTLYQLYFINPE